MSEKGLSPYGFLVKGQGLLGREGEPGSMPAFFPSFFLAKGISRVAVFPSLPSRETFLTTCSSPPPPSTPTTVVRSHSSLFLPPLPPARQSDHRGYQQLFLFSLFSFSFSLSLTVYYRISSDIFFSIETFVAVGTFVAIVTFVATGT